MADAGSRPASPSGSSDTSTDGLLTLPGTRVKINKETSKVHRTDVKHGGKCSAPTRIDIAKVPTDELCGRCFGKEIRSREVTRLRDAETPTARSATLEHLQSMWVHVSQAFYDAMWKKSKIHHATREVGESDTLRSMPAIYEFGLIRDGVFVPYYLGSATNMKLRYSQYMNGASSPNDPNNGPVLDAVKREVAHVRWWHTGLSTGPDLLDHPARVGLARGIEAELLERVCNADADPELRQTVYTWNSRKG